MRTITLLLTLALSGCVYDISRASDSRAAERQPLIGQEIILNLDGVSRAVEAIRPTQGELK